jgi:hypothetical protein
LNDARDGLHVLVMARKPDPATRNLFAM